MGRLHRGRLLIGYVELVDQDVAWVRVGVEEVVDENLLHEVPDQDMGNVLALVRQLRIVIILAVLWEEMADTSPFHRLVDQDLGGAVLSVDLRDGDDIVTIVEPVELLTVVDLVHRVDLAEQGPAELVQHLVEVDHRHLVGHVLEELDRPPQQGNVGVDQLADRRVLDLDHHWGTVLEGRVVDLANRGRGKGLVVEAGEDFIDFVTGLGLEGRLDAGKGVGFNLVLELTEGLDVGRRDQVRPGRQDLPHLDEGRAELLEGGDDLRWVLLVVEVAEKVVAAHHRHDLAQALPLLDFTVGRTGHLHHSSLLEILSLFYRKSVPKELAKMLVRV